MKIINIATGNGVLGVELIFEYCSSDLVRKKEGGADGFF